MHSCGSVGGVVVTDFNPVFYEKTKDGEVMFDVPSRLLKDRVIFLDREITDNVASTIASLMYLLDREDQEEPISLWINSPGGGISDCFAIYDMMYRVKAPIRTVCVGAASSCAALLLSAGTKGERFCMSHSRVMIHDVQISNLGGSGSDIDVETKEINSLRNMFNEIMARHTGQTLSKIKRDVQRDYYMSAEQAKEYGVVDKIMPNSKSKKIPQLKTNTKKKRERNE
jgi:ATP-dependent Clp protease, protease subunit